MMSGYLYVLVHPSDPDLHKVGQTTRHPEERLVEHNSNYSKHAGRIVKETGQKWELKTYISVPDPKWAEREFWNSTGLADMPGGVGVEIVRMEWKRLQAGLIAAQNAGTRPPPRPLPDYVHANTAWMKKRLEGRGITLLGHVKSKRSGRNNFQCTNGHTWRTIPNNVAEGEGCPHCGTGARASEEIREAVQTGVLCLLTNPNAPGRVNVGLTYGTLDECFAEYFWSDWHVHRYRNVEEPAIAEALIWELLGCPLPHDRKPISIDLDVAERAFRQLHYRLDGEIASMMKATE